MKAPGDHDSYGMGSEIGVDETKFMDTFHRIS